MICWKLCKQKYIDDNKNIYKIIPGLILSVLFIMNCANTSTNLTSDEGPYSVTNNHIKLGDYPSYYGLALPKDYNANSDSLPLFVALHYGGTPTNSYGREFLDILVVPAFGSMRAIMVAPVTPSSGTWTSSACDDVIHELIDHIKNNYSIDTSKIIITGFSMGGIGTWYHASKNPQKFSAAIVLSAMPDKASKERYAKSSLPMYVIHSTSDEIFPYSEVDSLVKELKNSGSDITLNTVNDISHYYTAAFTGALKKSIPWLEERLNLSE
jgi:predicted peptidase